MTAAPTTKRSEGRGRAILVGILYVLTCLAVAITVILVWTHQVALDTDRYVKVVERVTTDPEVVPAVADRLAAQAVTGTDLQTKVADALPDRAKPLAPLLTNAIGDALAAGLERGLAGERFQAAWNTANRLAHQQIVRLLRGEGGVVTTEEGVVTLNLLPLVTNVLTQLQASGVIPPSITIPDLSNEADAAAARQRLEAALGVTLPPDIGQIPLARTDSLERARTLVSVFDWVVVGAIALTIALAALCIWLARRRWRMAAAIALGAALVLVATGLLGGSLRDAVVTGLAAEDRTVLSATVRELVGDLVRWLFVIAILASIVAIAIVAWSLRDRVPMGGGTGGGKPAGEASAEPVSDEAAASS
jgi:hypothetical protein